MYLPGSCESGRECEPGLSPAMKEHTYLIGVGQKVIYSLCCLCKYSTSMREEEVGMEGRGLYPLYCRITIPLACLSPPHACHPYLPYHQRQTEKQAQQQM